MSEKEPKIIKMPPPHSKESIDQSIGKIPLVSYRALQNLQIILAWQMGKLSEGMAAEMIGVDRSTLRTMRDDAVDAVIAG